MLPRVMPVPSAIILKRCCRANYSSKAEIEQRGFFLSVEKGMTLKSPGLLFNFITQGIREEKLRKTTIKSIPKHLKGEKNVQLPHHSYLKKKKKQPRLCC